MLERRTWREVARSGHARFLASCPDEKWIIKRRIMKNVGLVFAFCTGMLCGGGFPECRAQAVSPQESGLVLNESNYFEARGLNFFVFSNVYDATFDDSKISAVEVIHHGIRTATNGDVRMNPTPGQWDKLPKFGERKVDKANRRIDVLLSYPEYGFDYTLSGEARDGGFYLSVTTEKPLPAALEGVAGLNLELVPPVFWGHSYMMDGQYGLFPTSPADNMTEINGEPEPTPMVTGQCLEVAPDEPSKHLTIRTTDGKPLMLFDGRNKQQNGMFVVRTLLPAGATGKIAEWFIRAETLPGWVREPVIGYSQVGYHPSQEKVAVVELDKNDRPLPSVSLLKVGSDGTLSEVLSAAPESWGMFTRYRYLRFDFSAVTEPGIYVLKYGEQQTGPFKIGADVYQRAWYPTLDVFMPVQMDHMFVREAYRVWHGAAHLDDALQAPLNRVHWDGWRQGDTTGNKYKPLEHIPGLNVGGWFDAGDFDIQTGSQQSVVQSLAYLWEDFRPERDETTVDQQTRYTEIHLPDGKPDVLQQLEHGVLQLVAQVKAIGYAIPGINESHLYQYRHLGDAVTKTDNLVYNPALDSLQTDGKTSGTPDDRWAFTNKSSHTNYNSALSLAAAARALADYNPELSREALACAEKIWRDEHAGAAAEGQGGRQSRLGTLECRTAFELWRTTGKADYEERMKELFPEMLRQFDRQAQAVARMIPFMGDAVKAEARPKVEEYVGRQARLEEETPYGVWISPANWAGNGNIVGSGITNYLLHRLYPDLVSPAYVYRGLSYLFGCHPCHNLSFVSGVGARPKQVAYGNNRADYTFIPGGIVPGVRILKPDFPENRDDYPFLWSENEYVISLAASYVYYVHAVNDVLK